MLLPLTSHIDVHPVAVALYLSFFYEHLHLVETSIIQFVAQFLDGSPPLFPSNTGGKINGSVHFLTRGDTISALAGRYHVDPLLNHSCYFLQYLLVWHFINFAALNISRAVCSQFHLHHFLQWLLSYFSHGGASNCMVPLNHEESAGLN